MDKLVFSTAGIPNKTKPRSYEQAFNDLTDMNLGGLEVEFVHGVNMNPNTSKLVREISKKKNLVLTAHGPYYINLNSQEQEKIDASITRIIQTARAAHSFEGYSITFHAAFYMKMDKEYVYKKVRDGFEQIIDTLKSEDINIWIRPETTGKETQWGNLDEVIRLSKEFDMVLPCIDFSHLHARTAGKFNTYDEFSRIFERIGAEIGEYALKEFHSHIAGIEYTLKGERRHLNLQDADMNYKDLLKAFKAFDVKGVIVCESPNIEDDAVLLQEFYNSL